MNRKNPVQPFDRLPPLRDSTMRGSPPHCHISADHLTRRPKKPLSAWQRPHTGYRNFLTLFRVGSGVVFGRGYHPANCEGWRRAAFWVFCYLNIPEWYLALGLPEFRRSIFRHGIKAIMENLIYASLLVGTYEVCNYEKVSIKLTSSTI